MKRLLITLLLSNLSTEGTFEGADIRNSGWTNNSNVTFHIKPFSCMSMQAQYFLTTPQYFPQFTTGLIHFCNFGIKLTQPGRSGLSYTLLLNDAFNTRRGTYIQTMQFIHL